MSMPCMGVTVNHQVGTLVLVLLIMVLVDTFVLVNDGINGTHISGLQLI